MLLCETSQSKCLNLQSLNFHSTHLQCCMHVCLQRGEVAIYQAGASNTIVSKYTVFCLKRFPFGLAMGAQLCMGWNNIVHSLICFIASNNNIRSKRQQHNIQHGIKTTTTKKLVCQQKHTHCRTTETWSEKEREGGGSFVVAWNHYLRYLRQRRSPTSSNSFKAW